MCENEHRDGVPGKCLCSYCSGSIARGMTAINEKNVAECNQLADAYIRDKNHGSLDELSTKLDSLNPVQCFDVLDKLCGTSSSVNNDGSLDELIMKFVVRFRNNGGFFLALKEPISQRQHLLQHLMHSTLTNEANAQKANLTPTMLS